MIPAIVDCGGGSDTADEDAAAFIGGGIVNDIF